MRFIENVIIVLIAILASLGVLSILACFRKKLPDGFPYPLVCGITAGVICLLLSIMITN